MAASAWTKAADATSKMCIRDRPIPEEYVIRFVEQERGFFEPLHPSFFELTTAMAFGYFADEKVDVAVIEVGLGGRLDCTLALIHIDVYKRQLFPSEEEAADRWFKCKLVFITLDEKSGAEKKTSTQVLVLSLIHIF